MAREALMRAMRGPALRGWFVAAAILVGCRGDPAPGGSLPAANGTGAAGAGSAGRECLPANVCDQWVGCALVVEDPPGRWSVVAGDQVDSSAAVAVTNVCTTTTCRAAKVTPRGVTCRPWSVPPLIAPPDYQCVWDGPRCRRS